MSQSFRETVQGELTRMSAKRRTCQSWHEAYGLILEEMDEFWDEVKKKAENRDKSNALKELSQIAALCERAAIDLGLVEQ